MQLYSLELYDLNRCTSCPQKVITVLYCWNISCLICKHVFDLHTTEITTLSVYPAFSQLKETAILCNQNCPQHCCSMSYFPEVIYLKRTAYMSISHYADDNQL